MCAVPWTLLLSHWDPEGHGSVPAVPTERWACTLLTPKTKVRRSPTARRPRAWRRPSCAWLCWGLHGPDLRSEVTHLDHATLYLGRALAARGNDGTLHGPQQLWPPAKPGFCICSISSMRSPGHPTVACPVPSCAASLPHPFHRPFPTEDCLPPFCTRSSVKAGAVCLTFTAASWLLRMVTDDVSQVLSKCLLNE